MKPLRIVLWSSTAAWWVLMLILTHLPPQDVPQTPVSDKVSHFVAYGVLGLLLALALCMSRPHARAALTAFAFCLLSGAIDEWTQPWVGRDREFADWLADAGGAALAVLVVLVTARLWRIRQTVSSAPDLLRSEHV